MKTLKTITDYHSDLCEMTETVTDISFAIFFWKGLEVKYVI